MPEQYAYSLEAALQAAKNGIAEGGMPFGAVLVDSAGQIVASGHNRQIQDGRWLAHAETECLNSFLTTLDKKVQLADATLVATEAPCPMCAGSVIICGIPTVVIGESVHYGGAVDQLKEAGVTVIDMDDRSCIDLVTDFREEHPDRWARFSAG